MFDVFVVVSDHFLLMFNVFVADLFGIHRPYHANYINIKCFFICVHFLCSCVINVFVRFNEFVVVFNVSVVRFNVFVDRFNVFLVVFHVFVVVFNVYLVGFDAFVLMFNVFVSL